MHTLGLSLQNTRLCRWVWKLPQPEGAASRRAHAHPGPVIAYPEPVQVGLGTAAAKKSRVQQAGGLMHTLGLSLQNPSLHRRVWKLPHTAEGTSTGVPKSLDMTQAA